MYTDEYGEEITRKLAKLNKKDPKHFQIVRKKMDWILENPGHRYKDLHYTMKGINRIHIGHFVLTFTVDDLKKVVYFEDYDHHDNIYGK